jgi:hypothetical protein
MAGKSVPTFIPTAFFDFVCEWDEYRRGFVRAHGLSTGGNSDNE